jgi:hypothetical protein
MLAGLACALALRRIASCCVVLCCVAMRRVLLTVDVDGAIAEY